MHQEQHAIELMVVAFVRVSKSGLPRLTRYGARSVCFKHHFLLHRPGKFGLTAFAKMGRSDPFASGTSLSSYPVENAPALQVVKPSH